MLMIQEQIPMVQDQTQMIQDQSPMIQDQTLMKLDQTLMTQDSSFPGLYDPMAHKDSSEEHYRTKNYRKNLNGLMYIVNAKLS